MGDESQQEGSLDARSPHWAILPAMNKVSEAGKFLSARDFLIANRLDYAKAYREFRWPELTAFNWVSDYFDFLSANNPAPGLLVVSDQGQTQLSFAELHEQSLRFSRYLFDQGLQPGDRILVMLPGIAELWPVILGAMRAGIVVIPTATILSTHDLSDRLQRSGAKAAVADPESTAKFPASYPLLGIVIGEAPGWISYAQTQDAPAEFPSRPERRATELAFLYFTSGTTARPKLVTHTQASYPVGHLSTLYWTGLRPGDLHLNISSPGWGKHAWSSFFAPWNAGATIISYLYQRFDPAGLKKLLHSQQVNSLCAPPTVWRRLVQEGLGPKPAALQQLLSAGEPLTPEIFAAVRDSWGLLVRDGFGQTETTAQIGNPPGLEAAPRMGFPLPGYSPELVDENGVQTEQGEIVLPLEHRPLGLTPGYLDSTEATARAFRNGYYHTGDVARRGRDGSFSYVGRIDDLFKSSDYRISPMEIEAVLLEHPAIAEVAVIPYPDPIKLFVPKACIKLRPGFEPGPEAAREIFAFAWAQLSPYARIRRIEFCELPRTISEKIRRAELRNRPSEGPLVFTEH